MQASNHDKDLTGVRSGTTPRQAEASLWDGVVADLNRAHAAASSAKPTTSVQPMPVLNHGWDAVASQISAEMGGTFKAPSATGSD